MDPDVCETAERLTQLKPDLQRVQVVDPNGCDTAESSVRKEPDVDYYETADRFTENEPELQQLVVGPDVLQTADRSTENENEPDLQVVDTNVCETAETSTQNERDHRQIVDPDPDVCETAESSAGNDPDLQQVTDTDVYETAERSTENEPDLQQVVVPSAETTPRVQFNLDAISIHELPECEDDERLYYSQQEIARTVGEIIVDITPFREDEKKGNHSKCRSVIRRVYATSATANSDEFPDNFPPATRQDLRKTYLQEGDHIMGLEQHLVADYKHDSTQRKRSILKAVAENDDVELERITRPSRVFAREIAMAQAQASESNIVNSKKQSSFFSFFGRLKRKQ